VSLPSAAHVFPPALTPSLSVLSLWNTSLDNILQHLSLVLIPPLDSLRIFPSSLPLASSRLMDPPFVGIVETTLNALILFESSRRDHLPRITRRLAEKERGMIRSGAVFVGRLPSFRPFARSWKRPHSLQIFDRGESGIKRWTDGLVWSPSRSKSSC
jgi:hypothetical protein